jgi:hypothetical protein
VSGFWEIEASVSPGREILADGSEQLLVRVQITDPGNADPTAHAFIDLRCTCARRLALEILAAADDADRHTQQDGCPTAGTMSAPDRATPTLSALRMPAIPTRARAIAARLAALFETDQEIVARLNGAHRLFAAANDRLRSGPAADPLVAHEQVDRAFCAYQQASEQRRQLAVDVGELSQQLTDALTAAGYQPEHARSASVHELAAGIWQPPENGKESRR